MRPYRHYSDHDLAELAYELDTAVENSQGSPEESYLMKQLALVDAEISEREFEES